MARQRPLIGRRNWQALALGIAALIGGSVRSDAADKPAPQSPQVPLGSRPYAIRAHLSCGPSARVDSWSRSLIIDEWLGLTLRFVGDPWEVDAIPEVATVAAIPTEALTADALRPLAKGVDKVWAIRVEQSKQVFVLEGREFDQLTGRLGEVHRVEVPDRLDLPRGLLTLARAVFEPVADVGESRDGGVSFEVQGGAIDPANPLGAVAPVGAVFRAFRLFLKPDGTVTETREIPYAYFRVEARVGSVARCAIIKGPIADPLTKRQLGSNRIVALGTQPARAPTKLRFLLRGDRSPAAGYKLLARGTEPDAKSSEVGITDREGRVNLPANFADGLVFLRVIAGNDEPMADVPIMPGETRTERTISFEGRPKTLELEARLDALRDSIVDVVASRSRLEGRMKARIEGEDLGGFQVSLAEFRQLPTRDSFEAQLRQLQTDAEQTEAESKTTTVLTRNARNQIDDTKALITRYLEDDLVRGMIEAAEDLKTNQANEAKAKAKAKPKAK